MIDTTTMYKQWAAKTPLERITIMQRMQRNYPQLAKHFKMPWLKIHQREKAKQTIKRYERLHKQQSTNHYT